MSDPISPVVLSFGSAALGAIVGGAATWLAAVRSANDARRQAHEEQQQADWSELQSVAFMLQECMMNVHRSISNEFEKATEIGRVSQEMIIAHSGRFRALSLQLAPDGENRNSHDKMIYAVNVFLDVDRKRGEQIILKNGTGNNSTRGEAKDEIDNQSKKMEEAIKEFQSQLDPLQKQVEKATVALTGDRKKRKQLEKAKAKEVTGPKTGGLVKLFFRDEKQSKEGRRGGRE